MKVFISYSHVDKSYAYFIADRLRQAGHEIWMDSISIKVGENIFEQINSGIKEANALIIIISQNSLNSKSVMSEISTIAFSNLSNKDKKIIPVLIDESSVPQYLAQYLYVNMTANKDAGLQAIVDSLEVKPKKLKSTQPKLEAYDNDNAILSLNQALRSGCLTLVCGAGISVDAGIPSWNDLLVRLLKSMINRISKDQFLDSDSVEPVELLNKGASSLMVGKYLKTNLGKDFLTELRHSLYIENPTTCETIDTIVEMARPGRNIKTLDSIITFNFDDLLEEQLGKHNIKHKAVFTEGTRIQQDELPIYHVHGFLPRKSSISELNDVVLSEDAYHSQFIDSFSWSNLAQLNKFSNNICLFIGLSFSDPNLRRLLDVASRKNPSKSNNHYIIKKTQCTKNTVMDRLMMFLEEQDALTLGINVIWINDFTEIPKVLSRIINE